MADGKASLAQYSIVGTATCVGGKHPDPPLDGFPKLVWMVSHPVHGSRVFTEDQAASVEQIALAACETPSFDAIAARFGTTHEHVSQAIAYALKAGYLGD